MGAVLGICTLYPSIVLTPFLVNYIAAAPYTKNKKWCSNNVWRSTGYCSQCGSKDVSCGTTCSNQVCDVVSNRWCDSGTWSSLNYCAHCQDTECLDTCINGACDINVKKWCNNGVWSDVDYCDNCGTKDSSCLVACEENTCDTTANKRCTNGIWVSANYCDYCALKDSDCTISCAEGECDRVNRRVCTNGEWVESSYTDLCVAQEVIVPVMTCNDYGNCTVGSTCTTDSECSSGFCYNDECAEPTCDDGDLNGDETDIDCGGGCESKCQLGRNCEADRDCGRNLMCTSGTCTEIIPVVETIPEEEKDSDGDGIPDEWEFQHGLDIYDPSDAYADFDEDGLTNIQEYTFGTNPNIADSDRDSVSDREEIIRENTDPLDPVSKPGGIGGLLIWTVVLIIVFGAGSYAVYYYKDYLINLIRPEAAEQIPISRQVPFKRQYAPQKHDLKTASRKTRIAEIIEKRREVKREKREKLLEVFIGKNAPKHRKTSSTKEGIFSKLRSTSKKGK